MQKFITYIVLLSMATFCCAMDKDVHYIVYQKLHHGVRVTKIDFFLPSKALDTPEKLIKTIYLNENQTKAFMQLVEEESIRKAWLKHTKAGL